MRNTFLAMIIAPLSCHLLLLAIQRFRTVQQAGSTDIWDAIATKNVALVRLLLRRNPELAAGQHPDTQKTPFMTALHTVATDDQQDRKLAEIMHLVLQTAYRLRQPDHAAGAEAPGAEKRYRSHRARMVINLDNIMVAS